MNISRALRTDKYEMQTIAFSLFFILHYITVNSLGENKTECDTIEIQKLCFDQETCDECKQAHSCCYFCYDKNYTNRRCSIEQQLLNLGCPANRIEKNSASGFDIEKELPFSVVNEDSNLEEIVQIWPQKINLRLRKDVPVNFTFQYKPADNYPLDLYYLGDLSLSMSQNIEIFKSLGKDLPQNLSQLTRNYKLAYGSFVDKPGMPFYFTDPISYDNPCYNAMVKCERGYSFKHRLDFTKDTNLFLEKVEASQLTANVDDLDGALDAIYQILICSNKFGFSKSSRRIILLPTDSLLHSAGDGVLVGAVLRPTDKCLIDDQGNYAKSLIYDYPSLQQIEILLREKKVNIIFAVKTLAKLQYYLNMTRDTLKGYAFVGELEERSENILELIKNGFYNFAETVNFYINTTRHEHIDVQIFADCENRGIFNETSVCYGVKKDPVQFKAQITLKDLPKTQRKDILYVEEKNINEKIELSVEYIFNCQCEGYEFSGNETCVHGELRCGECMCQTGWTGKSCTEECNMDDTNNCRSMNEGYPSKICYNNGICECGRCTCESPYSGKFCEHLCPLKRINAELIICGGPSKGQCIDGECICTQGFTGRDCSCSTSQEDCSLDGTQICSNQGYCECNKCKCNSDGVTGKYCEKSRNAENNILCLAYEKDVIDVMMKNGSNVIQKSRRIKIVDESAKGDLSCDDGIDSSMCQTSVYEGNSLCILEYCYYKSETEAGTIIIAVNKICAMTAGLKAIFLAAIVVAAVFVAGLLLIISYKYKIYRQEQAEYKEFMNAYKNTAEMNPIYKNPVTQYHNPLRAKRD